MGWMVSGKRINKVRSFWYGWLLILLDGYKDKYLFNLSHIHESANQPNISIHDETKAYHPLHPSSLQTPSLSYTRFPPIPEPDKCPPLLEIDFGDIAILVDMDVHPRHPTTTVSTNRNLSQRRTPAPIRQNQMIPHRKQDARLATVG